MKVLRIGFWFFIIVFLVSCAERAKTDRKVHVNAKTHKVLTTISDCNYTFNQAIEGTTAPDSIIRKLVLFRVEYYSTDQKLHSGQLLSNEKIKDDLIRIFELIKKNRFPVKQVIPVVRYNWNDELSMEANNTYSFCYRNVSFSKHARGMAIDINPYFNPQRWKGALRWKPVKPNGAIFDTIVSGTFTSRNPVVQEFKKMGFKWGHDFKMKYDDHHFEK